MKNTLYRSCLLLLCGFLFVVPTPAGAASFPAPVDDYINDYARILKPADEKSIRDLLQTVRSQTGSEMTLATIENLYDYADPGQSLESFAMDLFNHWGIGKKASNNGVLILFALKDRKVRIQLGTGYGSRDDTAMREVIDDKMIPHFREEEYSRGLYEGTRGIVERLTRQVSWYKYYARELIMGGVALICLLAGISCMRKGKKGWGWIFFSIAGTLLVSLIVSLLFRRGRGGKGFGGGRSSGGGASGSW